MAQTDTTPIMMQRYRSWPHSPERPIVRNTIQLADQLDCRRSFPEHRARVAPIDEQRCIASCLDGVAKVDRRKTLQQKTATQLDALLSRILNTASKGEL